MTAMATREADERLLRILRLRRTYTREEIAHHFDLKPLTIYHACADVVRADQAHEPFDVRPFYGFLSTGAARIKKNQRTAR